MIQKDFSRPTEGYVFSTVRWLYLTSIFLAVIQFGSVRPFPVTISAVFACAVALVSLIVFGAPARGRWLFLTISLLGTATFLWVGMQSVQYLPAGLDNPLWRDLAIASLPTKGSISIAPADSMEALLFVAVPLLAFLTGMTVIRSDGDARMVINALAIGGAVCGLYGLVQFSFFPDTNLFFPKTFYLDSLTATFVNRNTAGTFLGLATLVMLRFVWSLGSQISIIRLARGWLARHHVDTKGLPSFLLALFLLICAALALLLTKSRGATASSVVAIGLLFYFLYAKAAETRKNRFRSSGRSRPIVRTVAILLAFLMIAGIFGERTLQRAEAQGADDARYCILPGMVELAKGEPSLGYGFGSFLYAFPPYREADCGLAFLWDRAHNVYLEGFIGLGAIFPLIVIIGCGALLIAHGIGIRDRRRMRSYSMLGIAGIVLVGLHSLIDFSIQIPGMAAYAAGLIAATSSISLAKAGRQEKKLG